MKRALVVIGILLVFGSAIRIGFEVVPIITQTDVGSYDVPCSVRSPTPSSAPQEDCAAAENNARLSAQSNRRAEHMTVIWYYIPGLILGIVLVFFGFKKNRPV